MTAEQDRPQDAQKTLASLERQLNRLQRSIRLSIQTQLAGLTGTSLDDLESNRQLAESIHQLLDGHGLRMQCSECGHPAILRVSPRTGVANGVFVFDHSIEGRRTFHGGKAVMPEIRLIAKPARKRPVSKGPADDGTGGKTKGGKGAAGKKAANKKAG